VSTIRKFGSLFNVLTVLRAVFRMVFGFSARSRRGFRPGLAKWATVGRWFSEWSGVRAVAGRVTRGAWQGAPREETLLLRRSSPYDRLRSFVYLCLGRRGQPTGGGFATSHSGSFVHRRSVSGLIPTARAALSNVSVRQQRGNGLLRLVAEFAPCPNICPHLPPSGGRFRLHRRKVVSDNAE
jgi:hypothetical protein